MGMVLRSEPAEGRVREGKVRVSSCVRSFYIYMQKNKQKEGGRLAVSNDIGNNCVRQS